MSNQNKEKYLEALGMGRNDNLLVAACSPSFVQEAMDAMDEGLNEDYGENGMYYIESKDFIFTDFVSRPADLVDKGVGDLPRCYFDSYKELEDYDLAENAMIITEESCYFNDDVDDDDDKPSLKKFNEDFGTDFSSFAECWDWVLDEERSGQNFVVNVFRDGEMC